LCTQNPVTNLRLKPTEISLYSHPFSLRALLTLSNISDPNGGECEDNMGYCALRFIALMTAAVNTSETSVLYETTCRIIPEGCHLKFNQILLSIPTSYKLYLPFRFSVQSCMNMYLSSLWGVTHAPPISSSLTDYPSSVWDLQEFPICKRLP
jgi:hypothetical protein